MLVIGIDDNIDVYNNWLLWICCSRIFHSLIPKLKLLSRGILVVTVLKHCLLSDLTRLLHRLSVFKHSNSNNNSMKFTTTSISSFVCDTGSLSLHREKKGYIYKTTWVVSSIQ